MTTVARIAEADRVELVYQYALAQIGVSTIEEALSVWADVPVTQTADTAGRWLNRATQLILMRRGQAQKLALAYYRLVRALRTGTTITDPTREPEPDYISLEMLRREFELLVDDASPEEAVSQDAEVTVLPEVEEAAQEAADDAVDDGGELDPEPLDEDDAILAEEIAELLADMEADAESTDEYIAQEMEAMGSENLDRKVEKLDPEAPSKETDAARKAAHRKVAAQQAAAAAKIAMNGGRNQVYAIAKRDERAIGYVRMSTTGSPCYWCAMLISRSMLYKSFEAAGNARQSDGSPDDANKFHDNCYCVSVPVFTEEQRGSDIFAANRYYNQLWDKHIAGKYGGNRAINEWRKLLARLRTTEKTAAQEAA